MEHDFECAYKNAKDKRKNIEGFNIEKVSQEVSHSSF